MSENMDKKITGIVDMLMEDYKGGRIIDEIKLSEFPNKEKVIDILENIRKIILTPFF